MVQVLFHGTRVRLETDGGRADVILDSPERRNALDLASSTELRDALRIVAATSDVRVLVLRATGSHFCVGGDLRDFAGYEGAAATAHLAQIVAPLHEAVLLLDGFPFPVVTVAQGSIAGAGVGLAYRGDLVLLADDAVTRLAYTAVGLSPDGGSSEVLTRVLGPRRATELLLTNRAVTADTAVAWGLASRAVPPADLEAVTTETVDALLAGVPAALAAAKRLAREAAGATLADHLAAEQASITALIGQPAAHALIAAFTTR